MEPGSISGTFSVTSFPEPDRRAIEQHLVARIGPISEAIPTPLIGGPVIDLLLMPDNDPEGAHVVATCGVSAYAMPVPDGIAERHERIELMLGLPGAWSATTEALRDGRTSQWPLLLLRFVASAPHLDGSYLDLGHTVLLEGGPGALPGCLFQGAMLVPASFVAPDDIIPVPSGWDVTFMGVIPLLGNELDFKAEHGADALYQELRRAKVGLSVDPSRRSAVG